MTRAAARGEKAGRIRARPEWGDGGGVTGAGPATVGVLGARKVFREPIHFHGDVFPLPCPVDDGFPHDVSSLCSRRSRQRVQRRRCLHQREYGTIWALNHLAGFDDESLWPSSSVNQAQAAVLARVKKAYLQRPPPPDSCCYVRQGPLMVMACRGNWPAMYGRDCRSLGVRVSRFVWRSCCPTPRGR